MTMSLIVAVRSPSSFEARAITFEAIDKPVGQKRSGRKLRTQLSLSQPHHAEDHAADTVAMTAAVMGPWGLFSVGR
jgi:hypothetical protein